MFSSRKCTKSRKIIFTGTVLVILTIVHVYLIPSFTESYNKDCYLDKQKFESLKYLLTSIIEAFNEQGVFYWLDYGTLLGAERFKNIIPWDGDGDVSFILGDSNISMALHELHRKGIKANTMIASYDGMTVDFMRWRKDIGFHKGVKQKMLYKYYPPWVQDNIIIKLNHLRDTFPLAWIGERKQVDFLGKTSFIPKQHIRLLKERYKWTWWFVMPYKWKCYVPCFIYSKDSSCH